MATTFPVEPVLSFLVIAHAVAAYVFTRRAYDARVLFDVVLDVAMFLGMLAGALTAVLTWHVCSTMGAPPVVALFMINILVVVPGVGAMVAGRIVRAKAERRAAEPALPTARAVVAPAYATAPAYAPAPAPAYVFVDDDLLDVLISERT